MDKEIHPIHLKGNWENGYALDFHTIRSVYLGPDDAGHPLFDTERSKIGQLLYLLKYQSDRSVIPEIARLVASFSTLNAFDAIIPVPPSQKNRLVQPVLEIAQAIGSCLKLPVLAEVVNKTRATPELKNITDVEERKKVLQNAFVLEPVGALSEMNVQLFDDLYRSGATLCILTTLLYNIGQAKSVKVLTLTKTRSKS